MDRRLRKSCIARIRELERLDALHIGPLCEHLERGRGRPLDVIALDTPDADGPCGLWVATSIRDYVFYHAGASPLHQAHIVRHELAHVLCDHTGILNRNQREVLLPNLSDATIEKVLGRSDYTDREEAEAELIASLIGERVVGRGETDPGRADPALRRLMRLFE